MKTRRQNWDMVLRTQMWLVVAVCLVLSAPPVRSQSFSTYTDRHDFGGLITNADGLSGPDGCCPTTTVTFDNAGNMYGTTTAGGGNTTYTTGYFPNEAIGNGGVVWEITNAGAYNDLHDFGGTTTNANGSTGPDGYNPASSVAFDASGNIYGTALDGGANGAGMVWEITASGTYLDIHDFGGRYDSASTPSSGVTIDSAGNLYGTTLRGSPIWEITANGTYTLLSLPSGASSPYGGVTIDGAGNLYGTAENGGQNGQGMVWEITSGGTAVDLHDFGGTITNASGQTGPDGYNPQAGVSFDVAGNLYGTAVMGGAYQGDCDYGGMVWEITHTGTYLDLHDFGGTVTNANGLSGTDGMEPMSSVTLDDVGNMYGTTVTGGPLYQGFPIAPGIVWMITRSGAYVDLHDFETQQITTANGSIGEDGSTPDAGVTLDNAGNLLGIASNMGGTNANWLYDGGMVWEISLNRPVASAMAGNTQVSVVWSTVAGATSYSVYRGTLPGGESGTPITSVSTNSYTDTGLTNGTSYYYVVTATGNFGTSAPSTEVSAEPVGVPSTPAEPSAISGNSAASLAWPAATWAYGYNIYRGTSPGGESAIPVATSVSNTNFADTGLANGTTYYYTVASVNVSGTSGASPEASVVPVAIPGSLVAVAGNGQVALSWSSASNASSYCVYRGTTSGGETQIATGFSGTTYTDTDLTNSVRYYYVVAAVSAGNTSSPSTEAFATPLGSGSKLVFTQQPSNTTAGTNLSPAVTVQVEDINGNAIPTTGRSIAVGLTSANGATLSGTTTITTNANGLATFSNLQVNKVGTYMLTASDNSDGLIAATSQQFNISVGSPFQLAWMQQPTNTNVGTSINPAVTLQVEDAEQNPIPLSGDTIQLGLILWYSNGVSPNFGTPQAVTDSYGVATFTNLQIDCAGYVNLNATDLTRNVDSATSQGFTTTALPASNVSFVQQPTSMRAGQTMSPAVTVQVTDALGIPIPNDRVTITSPNGIISGTTTETTNAGGIATFSNLTGSDETTLTMTATESGNGVSAASNSFTISGGPATNLVIIQEPYGVAAGASISPMVLQLYDSFGFPSATPGKQLTATLTPYANQPTNGAVLSGTLTQTTNASGQATFGNLVITTSGTFTVTISDIADGYSNITSDGVTITSGSPGQLSMPAHIDGIVDQGISPLSVQLEDAYGNAVQAAGLPITMTLAADANGAQLSGTTTVDTNGSGIATFSNLNVNKIGTYTLSASDAGVNLTPVSSTLSVNTGPGSQITFVAEPSNATSSQVISPAIAVQIEDAAGDPVGYSGHRFSLAVTNANGATLSGTTTSSTNVSGLVTFANLSVNKVGTYTLTAADLSDPSFATVTSSSFTITAGSASQLVFVQQPMKAASGATISPAITLQAEDAAGNAVPTSGRSISIGLANANGATLAGTTTITTNANGLATFANLNITQAGTYTLTATDTSDSATAASSSFTITAGSASQLVFVQQPSNAASGMAISPAITLQAEDAAGNAVPTSGRSISIGLANANGATLAGTTTITTNANGLTTFANLNITKAGTYTLTATDTGDSATATSNSFTISAGTASQLVFDTSSATTGNAGADIGPVLVDIEDANGNLVTTGAGATAAVAIAIGSNPSGGMLENSAVTVNAVAGVASFTNDIAFNIEGVYTIQATSNGLTSATSAPITIEGPTSAGISVTPAAAFVGDPALTQMTINLTGTTFVPGTAVTITNPANASAPLTILGDPDTTDPSFTVGFGPAFIPAIGAYTLSASVPNLPSNTTATANLPVLALGPVQTLGSTPTDSVDYVPGGVQMFSVPYDYSPSQPQQPDNANYSNYLDEVDLTALSVVGTVPELVVWDPVNVVYDFSGQSASLNPANHLTLGRSYWARLPYNASPLQAVGLISRGLPATDPSEASNIDGAGNFMIPLHAGWNMIGDPWAETEGAQATGVSLNSVEVAYDGQTSSLADANSNQLVSSILYRYGLTDAGQGTYNYIAVSPGNTDTTGVATISPTNDSLYPYVGYWIESSVECTLLVPAPLP